MQHNYFVYIQYHEQLKFKKRGVKFMGVPTIPTVAITRAEAETLVLASIGAEGLALAHILNAEGEKIQAAVAAFPVTINVAELIAVDTSVSAVLRNVIKKEIILEFQLEELAGILGVAGAAVSC